MVFAKIKWIKIAAVSRTDARFSKINVIFSQNAASGAHALERRMRRVKIFSYGVKGARAARPVDKQAKPGSNKRVSHTGKVSPRTACRPKPRKQHAAAQRRACFGQEQKTPIGPRA
jgi:hypothetical protein